MSTKEENDHNDIYAAVLRALSTPVVTELHQLFLDLALAYRPLHPDFLRAVHTPRSSLTPYIRLHQLVDSKARTSFASAIRYFLCSIFLFPSFQPGDLHVTFRRLVEETLPQLLDLLDVPSDMTHWGYLRALKSSLGKAIGALALMSRPVFLELERRLGEETVEYAKMAGFAQDILEELW